MRRLASRLAPPALAVALALLALAAPARAAIVANGDFESGTLDGWHVHRLTSGGNWFAYEGTSTPISVKRGRFPVPPPPQGSHAAVTDELTADTLVLYQDLTLPAGSSDELSLLAYYDSQRPIAVPSPDTLSVEEEALGGQANQQFRIDLMRPEAPLESLAPGDVLATLFETRPGDPQHMGPTRLTASLAPFAGQTVRLRIAVAAHEELLNAGIDAVAVTGGGGGRGGLRVGKPRANPRNGTVVLPVAVPGPGRVGATGKRPGTLRAAASKVSAAGTVKLVLRPGRKTLRLLRRRRRARVRVTVSYAPPGGGEEALGLPVGFRLRRPTH
ncbi:MAG TPA: hypothetical protein VF731_07875 [Solirubrobacterales bacterium]